ncbi:MAG: thioredoxin 1 [Candidatus Tokpelaia sp. JSC085]|nr:MAG: thioredoxin 1 [Candidatus Tokpelaia sp. JSC085]
MAMIAINQDNFDTNVLKAHEPVVVDFWAEWCSPCKMIGPLLNEIATEMMGQIKIAKLNIDENPELARQFGVRSIPTLLMFKNGSVISNMVGAASKSSITAWINRSVK